jgi:hypothetical protein
MIIIYNTLKKIYRSLLKIYLGLFISTFIPFDLIDLLNYLFPSDTLLEPTIELSNKDSMDDNNNKLNNKHLVTAVVISVTLFMIIIDIYNFQDSSFIGELYSDYYKLEEAIKANDKIMNNIEKILEDNE